VRRVTDPRGTLTSYAYDHLDRPTAVTEAVGWPDAERTTRTVYDRAGNVLSITNGRPVEAVPAAIADRGHEASAVQAPLYLRCARAVRLGTAHTAANCRST
jgi:hypothetical protein